MAKANPPSLADDVLGRVVNNRPGFRTWFRRLPADAQEELSAAKAAFMPDVHQKAAFARALIAAAKQRGWEIAGEKQVIAWLVQKS